jgi:hypothetical protein
MRYLMRIAAVLFSSLVLLAMSACATASRPASGYSVQRGSPPGYSSGSLSTAPSSPEVSTASSAGGLASSDTIPAGYSDDHVQSAALTSYLQNNRLPLVGAQIFTNSIGDRRVILHGFVATDFGKQDAVAKSRRYLNEPRLLVVNRIVVRPELLASGDGGASSSSPSAPSLDDSYGQDELGVESYKSQAQTQQNQSEIKTLILLFQIISLFL